MFFTYKLRVLNIKKNIYIYGKKRIENRNSSCYLFTLIVNMNEQREREIYVKFLRCYNSKKFLFLFIKDGMPK